MSNADIHVTEHAFVQSLLPSVSNVEVEMMAVGSLLAFPRKAKTALLLRPQDFTDPMYAACFEAVMDLIARDGLGDNGANNAMVLSRILEPQFEDPQAERVKLIRLAGVAMMPFDLAGYAKTLRDLSTRRELIHISASTAVGVIDSKTFPNSSDAISDLGDKISMLNSDASRRVLRSDAVAETLEKSLNEDIRCLSTGFPALDDAMGGGMYERKAYGIAARKKQGKTVMGGQISEALMDQNIPHAYIALEMGAQELHERLMARRMNTNALAFRNPKIRRDPRFQDRYREARAQMREKCITYVDAPGITFDDMRRELSFLVASKGINAFVLDYLQLVGGQMKGESQAQHLDKISQWIAEFVRKHNLTAIVLAQINQEGNVRGGEGMRLAFDQVYELQQVEIVGADESRFEAFMTMLDTRYTKWGSIGTKENPALRLHTSIGPQFSEMGTARHSELCEMEERKIIQRQQYARNYADGNDNG